MEALPHVSLIFDSVRDSDTRVDTLEKHVEFSEKIRINSIQMEQISNELCFENIALEFLSFSFKHSKSK